MGLEVKEQISKEISSGSHLHMTPSRENATTLQGEAACVNGASHSLLHTGGRTGNMQSGDTLEDNHRQRA